MDNNQASSDIDRESEIMTLANFAEKNRLNEARRSG